MSDGLESVGVVLIGRWGLFVGREWGQGQGQGFRGGCFELFGVGE